MLTEQAEKQRFESVQQYATDQNLSSWHNPTHLLTVYIRKRVSHSAFINRTANQTRMIWFLHARKSAPRTVQILSFHLSLDVQELPQGDTYLAVMTRSR